MLITIDESLSDPKVDSYLVLRHKLYMSGCSYNGHIKYNERRRSEYLESQMKLRNSSKFQSRLRLILTIEDFLYSRIGDSRD